ncbi:MAG: hypothetical protein K8U57_20510 [Planctomycetes bacterium]|nr:hypothetical protein [Planctomycetota bacterium]
MAKRVYAPDDIVGEWTIIKYNPMAKLYKCRCSCGRESHVIVGALRRGLSVCCKACEATALAKDREAEVKVKPSNIKARKAK